MIARPAPWRATGSPCTDGAETPAQAARRELARHNAAIARAKAAERAAFAAESAAADARSADLRRRVAELERKMNERREPPSCAS